MRIFTNIADGLRNVVANLGTARDKAAHTQYVDTMYDPQDPTAAVRCAVYDRSLYIEYEAGKIGLENDDIAEYMIKKIPGIEKHTVRADNARPETISHVQSSGNGTRLCLPKIEPVSKWPGSVEDGIAHLRSYKEIIIHPRCVKVIHEARTYSYKVDRLTGDVLTTIVDKNNHYIDAIRYALEPMVKRSDGYSWAGF